MVNATPVKSRVRVDWNNDGHIHSPANNGIVLPNKYPDSLYPYSANMQALNYLNKDMSRQIIELDDRGLVHRVANLGDGYASYGRVGVRLAPYQWDNIFPENKIDGRALSGLYSSVLFDEEDPDENGFIEIYRETGVSTAHIPVKDDNMTVENGTVYSFGFQYIGHVDSIEIRDGSGTLRETVTTTYATDDADNRVNYPQVFTHHSITFTAGWDGTAQFYVYYNPVRGYLRMREFMFIEGAMDGAYIDTEDFTGWRVDSTGGGFGAVKHIIGTNNVSPGDVLNFDSDDRQYGTRGASLDNMSNGAFYSGLKRRISLKPFRSYTFRVYVRALYETDTTYNYAVGIISNNSGIVDSAGVAGSHNPSVDNTWQLLEDTFTTGKNTTDTTLYIQAFVPTGEGFEIGGVYMIENVYTPPYYEAISWQEEQFSTTLAPDTNHVFSFFARSDDSLDLDITLQQVQLNDTTVVSNDYTFTLSDSWRRYEINVSSLTYTHALIMSYDVTDDIEMRGFMVVEGDTSSIYNVDVTGIYDDISSYVLKIDWKTGVGDIEDALSYEGTAKIELNNVSRIFSPANTDSPLYGYLNQNLKVLIEVQNPDTLEWSVVWAGWTYKYDITPGLSSKRRVTIQCRQGMYRLREGEFSSAPLENKTISQAFETVFNKSAWRATNTPVQTLLGSRALLGINTHLVGASDIFTEYEQSHHYYNLIGDEWGRGTQVEDALKELLEAENMRMWLNRDGTLRLLSRSHFTYRPETFIDSFNLDNSQKANYEYGQKLVNRVEVHTKPKTVDDNEFVWQSKNRIGIQTGQTVSVALEFKFEEGTPRTVIDVQRQQSDMDITGYYTRGRLRDYTEYTLDDSIIAANIIAGVVSDGGNKYRLRIKNNFSFPVFLDVKIRGESLAGGDGVAYVFDNVASQELVNAMHKMSIDSHIITTEAEARGLADYHFLRYSLPHGAFTSMSLASTDTQRILDMLDYEIGTRLLLSESQTAETEKPHYIIAVEGRIEGVHMTMKYTMARIPKIVYGQVGDTIELGHRDLSGIRAQTYKNADTYAIEDGVAFRTTGLQDSHLFIGATQNITTKIDRAAISDFNTYESGLRFGTKTHYSTGADIAIGANNTVQSVYSPEIPVRGGKRHTVRFWIRFKGLVENRRIILAIKGVTETGLLEYCEIESPAYASDDDIVFVYDGNDDGTAVTGNTYLITDGEWTPIEIDIITQANGVDINRIGLFFEYATSAFEIHGFEILNTEPDGITDYNNIADETQQAVLFCRMPMGYDDTDYTITIRDYEGNSVASSSVSITDGDIQKIVIPVLSSENMHYIDIQKDASGDDSILYIYGCDIIEDGDTPRTYEDLSTHNAILRLFI